MMIFGRLIYGFAAGIQTVVTGRFIEEYVNVRYYSICMGTYCFSQNLGTTVAFFSAVALPPDSDEDALIESKVWFFIFGLPLVWYAIMLVLLLTIVRYEPPKYSIVNG